MNRMRATSTAVLGGAVLVAAGLTVPALAETTSPPQSAVVQLMSRDLGLTADQAQGQLAFDSQLPGLVDQIGADLGDFAAKGSGRAPLPDADLLSLGGIDSGAGQAQSRGVAGVFAGAWVDRDNKKLKIGITDPDAAAAVRRAGAEPKIVTYNAAQLATVKADLDRRATKITPTSAPGWYVDPATNSVVVLATPGREAAAKAWALKAGAPAKAVRIVKSNERPRAFAGDLRGAEPYLVNGDARCSVGFSVIGGFVSAGHCGQRGAQTTTGQDAELQGVFGASSFPGDDFSFVSTSRDVIPTPVVATERGDVPVRGSEEAPIGSTVCRSGSTTGTRCGAILAKNATVNYAEGAVTGLTRTNVCAEPGDSGGPFFSADQAQGMTSGGSGDCVSGGITFFQPVNEVLDRLDLTLVTTGAAALSANRASLGGQPALGTFSGAADGPDSQPVANDAGLGSGNANGGAAAIEAVPAACRGGQTHDGALAASGDQTLEPDQPFVQAPAGEQVLCLAGPTDADFNLALQRWSGVRWETVGKADSDDSSEVLRFDGTAGLYRYQVTSEQGEGEYTLTVR
ncbi:S1 family peptidase [Pilimelia columellifera]|uniref:Streptogrisin C n=1 Tax=Pilimelia columellifera subsp. columellifera TaxID=706583 RepID=A0ABP6AE94_9ACTN